MRILALALFAFALLLAGCSDSGGGATDDNDDGASSGGGGGGGATSGGGNTGTSSTAATTGPPDYNVELYDSRYDPTSLTVPNFQKVVFQNLGQLTHTVTIVKHGEPAGSYLRDQPIQNGATADFNFPNDGTYTVFCRYHGTEQGTGMAMTITV